MRPDRGAGVRRAGLVAFATVLGILASDPVHAAGTGKVFISNERSSEIFLLDASDQPAGSFKSCGRPRGMRFTPDHARLLVACGSDNTIAVYDVASQKLVKRFRDVPDPEAFDLHPNGHDLYISNEDDAEATVLNIDTGEVTAHYPVGDEPEGVLATTDGKLVFVASEAANLVQVIDVAANKVVKEIIDVPTLAIAGQVTFEIPGLRQDEISPVDIAITADGKTAYVAIGRANRVAVVDVASRKPVSYILTGRRPWGLRLTKDGRKLYVANGLSDDVAIVDTASNRVIKAVPVGVIPYAILIDE